MKGEGWEVGGKAGDDGRVEPSGKKFKKIHESTHMRHLFSILSGGGRGSGDGGGFLITHLAHSEEIPIR